MLTPRTSFRVALACGIVLAVARPVMADAWNKKTTLTVRERIEAPGAVLEPGNYVLRLVDSDANRHIVRILNERENKVITTVIAIPNYRLTPTGDTEFAWYERPAGEPPALRAWFYPGDNFGQEFVYPKRQAATLAGTVSVPVPTVADVELPVMTAQVQPAAPAAPELKAAPVVPTQPVQMAQARPIEPAPRPTPVPAPVEEAPATLPATGGLGAAFALMGILGLAGAAGLETLLRRTR